MSKTLDVLERLKADCLPAWEKAKVVGVWVWVEFQSPPAVQVRKKLLEIGFKYNGKRHCWQHNCGRFTPGAPYDPRDKYLVVSPTEFIEETAATV